MGSGNSKCARNRSGHVVGGPSTLSSIFFAVMLLVFLVDVAAVVKVILILRGQLPPTTTVGDTSNGTVATNVDTQEQQKKLAIALSVVMLIQLLGFYTYYARYKHCDAAAGLVFFLVFWLISMVVGVGLLQYLLNLSVMPAVHELQQTYHPYVLQATERLSSSSQAQQTNAPPS